MDILTRGEKEELNAEYLKEREELRKLAEIPVIKKKVGDTRKRAFVSFVPDIDSVKLLDDLGKLGIRSRFINNALRTQWDLQDNPLRLLKLLKEMYPNQWKYINRKQFVSDMEWNKFKDSNG